MPEATGETEAQTFAPVNSLGGTPPPPPPVNNLARFAAQFGVNPGMVVTGTKPGATPSPLPRPAAPMSGTPLDPNTPAPGSAADIVRQFDQWNAARRMERYAQPQNEAQFQAALADDYTRMIIGGATPDMASGEIAKELRAWQQISNQSAQGQPGDTGVHISFDPSTGQTSATGAGRSGQEGGPGGAFPAFTEALQSVSPGMSRLQAQIPINTLIGQWETKAPGYASQLQNLLTYAHMAALQWDSLASAPGASPSMATPLQLLGDNIDAWTLNSLTTFAQQTAQMFQQE